MRRRDDRGLAVSVEAAFVLPALLLFLGLLFSLARFALADQHIGSAAASGARAASIERTQSAAREAAAGAVGAALDQHNVDCLDTSVAVDAAAVARPLGERGAVVVRLTCQVSLADVTLPFIPGSLLVSAERSSPVDPLRGR